MDSYSSRAPRIELGWILIRALRSIATIVALVTLVTIVIRGRCEVAELARFVGERWPLWLLVFVAVVTWDVWSARTKPAPRDDVSSSNHTR